MLIYIACVISNCSVYLQSNLSFSILFHLHLSFDLSVFLIASNACSYCLSAISVLFLFQYPPWFSFFIDFHEPAFIYSTNQIWTSYSTKAGQHLSARQFNKTKKHLWASSELGWTGASLTCECYAMWWRMKQNIRWVDNKPTSKNVVRLLLFK